MNIVINTMNFLAELILSIFIRDRHRWFVLIYRFSMVSIIWFSPLFIKIPLGIIVLYAAWLEDIENKEKKKKNEYLREYRANDYKKYDKNINYSELEADTNAYRNARNGTINNDLVQPSVTRK